MAGWLISCITFRHNVQKPDVVKIRKKECIDEEMVRQ